MIDLRTLGATAPGSASMEAVTQSDSICLLGSIGTLALMNLDECYLHMSWIVMVSNLLTSNGLPQWHAA